MGLLDEFLEKYSRDFEITEGHHRLKSFIGLDVEQSRSKISLHLDAYNQENLDIYTAHPGTKIMMIRPKTTSMQPESCRITFLRLLIYRKCQIRSDRRSIDRWWPDFNDTTSI